MKAISRTAVLAVALIISAFVFGQIISSSAQTSGAASGRVDCSGVAPWAATTVYKPGDLLTRNNRLYKSLADIWNAPPDHPASAHWYQNMGECGDQPPTNRPPTGTLTTPTTVDSGAAATFTVNATDPDGDTLAYAWTRPAEFTGNVGNTASVTLTAPTVTADRQATITVQVSDGRGGTLPLSKTFTVKAPAPVNRPPTGTLTAPATVDSGASATFTVSASDPDGDALSYAWTRPTGFTGNAGNTASVTLTAPTVTADQQATITVQVSDGRGGTLPLSKTFTVKAPAPVNRPPTATLGGPPSVDSGAIATFVVTANDPDGDPLTYAWTRPQGFTGNIGNSNTVSLTAPTVTADTQATASVVVSDGRGGTVTATKAITVKAATPAQPPTVVVTGPATVESGTPVTIDASGSTGNIPGGGALRFFWTVPAGIEPEAATSPALQFVAPAVSENTQLEFTVRVDQGSVHASKSHRVTVTPKQGGPCAVEEYRNGYAYVRGDQVSSQGELYTCKQQGWCGQGPYEPGKPWNGSEIWRDAWTHDGKCESGAQGNVLKLEFSPMPTYVPRQQRLRQAKPLSGVLRCGAEETPFSANWGETLSIQELKACKYQLTVNAATSGHMPYRVPRVVEFKNESGEIQTEQIEYVQPVDLAQLKPLPGVKVEIFAQGLLEPRQMALGRGVIYVGSSALPYGAQPDVGNFIYALALDASNKVRGVHIVASGLEEPHGVAYRNGVLYYSTSDGIYRINGIDTSYMNHPTAQKVRSFPSDEATFPVPGPEWPIMSWRRWHMKHPIMFNPVNANDPWLYSMVGRVCNTCIMQPDPRYGTLIRYNVDTGAEQVLAYGVRNSVGWDWDPRTGDIWWSDNNRQRMYNGDEMNRLANPDANANRNMVPHFGSPYMYANALGFTQEEWATPKGQLDAIGYVAPVAGVVLSDKRPDQIDPRQYAAPSYVMGSGTAPLGVKFWNGYRPQAGFQRLLFATHSVGSNEREAGLEVDMLTIDSQSRVVAETPLITGWQKKYGDGGTNCRVGCSGRPVEFLSMPDGSLLVSDDIQGVIYRVTYDAAGLPGSLLKVLAPAAPHESIAKEMVTGSLTDSSGASRKLAIAWGSNALEFAGLPAGQYTLRLEDVGNWVPTKRTNTITVSGSGTTNFNFTYEPRKDGSGTITINAPPKPNARLVTETLDVQIVREKGDSDGTITHVAVPWGGSGVATVPYGTYIVRSPFVSPSYLPAPSANTVDVEQGEDATVAMKYQHVESMGHTIITETCSGCHSYAFFDDPIKADRWDRNGVAALVGVIKGMNVPGHCDDVCAGEVSEYLYNVTWKPYLEPEADSSTRQVRLLTRDEYRNSVQDVLGVPLERDLVPEDAIDLEFRYPGLADLGVVNRANVGAYYTLAVRVANQVDVQRLGYQAGGNNAAFVQKLGRRLYRHHLSDAQSARLQTYLQEHGPNTLIAAMLVSPYFLYRTELGDNSAGGLFRLTPSEVATLLSFGFLGTTPSEDLLDKADAGLLETPEQIATEVAAMLQTERGQEQFARFVRYYDRSYKDVGSKPGLDDQIIADMRLELDTFSKQLIASPTATMGELFNANYTFLNERLARHYGVPGVSGGQMQRVAVDRRRGGLLHMGILHASVSDNEATSLVKRGKMLREQMFCKGMGAAADGLEPDPVQYPPRPYSTAEYWTATTGPQASRGQCWICHQYMNEGGISFENYDQKGVYRDIEKAFNQASATVPIVASGTLSDNTGSGQWATFNNVRDISEHIPTNSDAQACLASSYYGFVQGEPVRGGARETVKKMAKELAGRGNLRQMLTLLATSDALLYRKEED